MDIETPEQFVEAQRLCIAKVRYYVDLANGKLHTHLSYPDVRFALNGMTGGTANAQKNLIKLNPTLLRENGDDYIIGTVGHEVAHLVARNLWPSCDPHGDEWKSVMYAFQLPATRCHQYDVSNVPSQMKYNVRHSSQPQNPNVKQIECGSVIEF